MKEKLSPAVTAVIIVVVLAAVGFFGYRTIAGGNSSGVSDKNKPAAAAQTQRMSQQYQNYGNQRGGSGTTGSYMQRGGNPGAPMGSSGMPGMGGPPSGYMNRGGAAGAYGR